MKRKNRLIGMVICLIILGLGLFAMVVMDFRLEEFSFILGFVVGWAFRETLANKEIETE